MRPQTLIGSLVLFLSLLLQPLLATAALYSDNRDGTVTDSATGLTWMRCSMGQTWDGSTCTGTAIQYPTWAQAKSWWEGSGVAREFAGKNDWRLPSGRELQSIVDDRLQRPAIDGTAFPNTPSITYWSATPHYYPNDVLSVDFASGYVGGQNRESPAAVRAVRGEQWLGSLTPLVDGTVADASTGLTWMRCSLGQTWNGNTCTGNANSYTWDEAKALKQSFAGQNDWRLPTERELFAIVDLSVLALDPLAFPNDDGGIYWSSSPYVGGTDRAWELSLGWLEANHSNKSSRFAVRMVRISPDRGDGTVFDSETGLTWMRCPLGQTWTGRTCLGEASVTDGYLRTLTHSYAGHSDWRVPSLVELNSIKQAFPSPLYIDLKAFPNTTYENWFANWSTDIVTYTDYEKNAYTERGLEPKVFQTFFYYVNFNFANGRPAPYGQFLSPIEWGYGPPAYMTPDLTARFVRGTPWLGPERSKPFADSWAPQDCLFNWAEKTFPEFFAPAGVATETFDVYNFRHYLGTQAYLGVSSRDNHLYYLGAWTNNNFLDLGPASDYYPYAKCQ